MLNVAQFVLVTFILVGTACCKEASKHLVRDLSKTFGTCLSQLGEAKNAIEGVKKFFQQVDELLPGFIDIKLMGKARADIDKLKAEMSEMQSFTCAIYIRWGRTTCGGNNTEVVYKESPDAGHQLGDGASDFLYGGEYEIYSSNKPNGMKSILANHNVPCVVCRAMEKSSSLMIPGRRRCFKDWSKEYNGFLMSGHSAHAKGSEYACMDKNAISLEGGSADENGNLFYPVKTVCGSLKCPKYVGGTDVSCVVCTI